jgi:hypothetical protein
MRVGASKRIAAVRLEEKKEALDFADHLASPADTVYVGLVGGSDPASMSVRWAQSFLRFDRRPSYFSNIFLFTGRGDAILECRVVGADPTRPETQGVVRDRARRYQNPEAWPNKALVGFTFSQIEGGASPQARLRAVLDAARNEKAVRERYDLWKMIAAWQPYLFEPHRTPNPLVERSPHPGAAYVRWALGMAGIEGAPGALDEFDAPEHFWAAANYWYETYEDASVGVSLTLVRDIADPAGTVTVPEPSR